MLSPSQIAASRNTTDKVISVFAGAGSGKTSVVVDRVSHLLESGVPSESILVITFTKKAAEELQKRIGLTGATVRTGTFHSVFLDLLRNHSDVIGMPYGIRTVLNELEVLQALTVYNRKFDKRMAIDCMAVSFDWILSLGLELLQKDPSLLAGEDCHIIVDESQDNSAIQWKIIEEMAAYPKASSLFVVGDFRQSIYEWRSASPELGIEFCKKTKQLFLNENYRSARAIVEHANRVIACGGFGSPMIPVSGEAGQIVYANPQIVHEYIAYEVESLASDMVPYEEMAVLCRYNADADSIARYLREERIPVDRKPDVESEGMMRLCAWANFQADHNNVLSWSAAIGAELSPSEKRAILSECSRCGLTPMDASVLFAHKNPGPKSEAIARIAKEVDPSSSLDEVPLETIATFGLSPSAVDWVTRKYGGCSIEKLPTTVSIDAGSTERESHGVFVGSAHSCKGLEFDHVFVAHCSKDKTEGYKKGRKKEEERRLIYVEATRPRLSLHYVVNSADQWSEFIVDEHGRPMT